MTLAPVAAGNGVELPHAVEEDLGAHGSVCLNFFRSPRNGLLSNKYELTFG